MRRIIRFLTWLAFDAVELLLDWVAALWGFAKSTRMGYVAAFADWNPPSGSWLEDCRTHHELLCRHLVRVGLRRRELPPDEGET